jgi:hypothetical protein
MIEVKLDDPVEN